MIAKLSAMTDSSPRLEVTTSPVTPKWSPMSTRRLKSARASAPTLPWESITWNSAPSPSRRRAKHSFPAVRTKMTRPTAATVTPEDSPASRSANRSRSSAKVCVPG